MTVIRKSAVIVLIVGLLAATLLSGCASKSATGAPPAQPGATGVGGIAVPNPTAPADAAQNAADQMNAQTQQTQQGVKDADPKGLTIQQ
jgi:hypothetical protein